MDQQWLTFIIVILIIGIVFDGIRRMHKARRDSIKMSLRPKKQEPPEEPEEDDGLYGSEFPNGGARVSENQIDVERIRQARSKFNFGQDIPSWGSANKDNESLTEEAKVEPSISDADPLLDDLGSVHQPIEQVEAASQDIIDPLAEEAFIHESDPLLADDIQDEPIDDEYADHSGKDASELAKPVQTSLNLEDTVPMLMDSLDTPESINPVAEPAPLSPLLEKPSVHDESPVHIEQPFAHEAASLDEALERDKLANKEPLSSQTFSKSKKPNPLTPTSSEAKRSAESTSTLQEVLVIHVRAPQGHVFKGTDLLEVILENGLRFGEMDIFHCHQHEDGEGPILYSMANMVKPGNFDLHSFESFSTIGLSFFLTLPTETNQNMEAFESMLRAAKNMAEVLQGELNDENRSVLTGQTIEHYRERIRDFSRRQQLDRHK